MATAHTPGASGTRHIAAGEPVQLNVRVAPELKQRLRVACARRTTTAQEVITGLVEEWLAREGSAGAEGWPL
jgi:ParG